MKTAKPNEWKRKAAGTYSIELTLEHDARLVADYQYVAQELDTPRHYMRAGFQEERLKWIGVIANAIRKGFPIPSEDFHEMVLILEKIAGGEPPAKAFGLENDKRKRRTIDLDKLSLYAECVYLYHKDGHSLSDYSRDAEISAFEMAAKHFGHEDNTRLQEETRLARLGWEIFGKGIKAIYEGRVWEEPHPPIEKLTPKKRRKN